MSILTTKKFSNHIADQLIESITEVSNTVYYVTANKHTEYASGDDNIPTPVDSFSETFLDYYREMIFGKRVSNTDIVKVIARNDWVSNTVYDMYDHTDGNLLQNGNFYVGRTNGSNYYVYKVIDNNGGTPSTVPPTNTSEAACNFITTADNYKWKLLYSVPTAMMSKFSTGDYVPVLVSANVVSNNTTYQAKGAIDVITVTSPGSSYVATLAGRFNFDDLRTSIPTLVGNTTTYRLTANASSNTDFYTGSAIYIEAGTGAGQHRRIVDYDSSRRVITVATPFDTSPSTDSDYIVAPNVVVSGDGTTEVAAYANVQSNSTVTGYVQSIQIVNRGSNYTYGTATLVGNTGGVSNSAILKVIIPPGEGHGYNPPSELGCTAAMISVSFANTESGFISTENDFRKLTLIKDPLFKNVTFTIDDDYGTFTAGEKIHQVNHITLTGSISSNSQNTTITGTGTQFTDSLSVGSKVIIFDSTKTTQFLAEVATVTSNVSIEITSNSVFDTTGGTIELAALNCSAIKVGNSAPYLNASNVEPKFVIGKRIIGESSGAWANVTAINVQEKTYNGWNTFDNRTRITYTANTGVVSEDSAVYQSDVSLSNAYFHSANSTHVFLTAEKGPINADPSIVLQTVGSSPTFTLGTEKSVPDIVPGSGEVIYIENSSPISRSNSQTETIKLVLNF